MPQFNITLVLLISLLISACGYHLRADIDLPEGLKSIYVQGGSGQLRKIIKKTLRSSDGILAENAEAAALVIKVVKERMNRNVLSLNSRGRANEYELYYVLDFLLLDSEGKKLIALQKIEIHKDYFNDQEDVLGKNNEEGVIRDEMYRQAVQSIFRRARIALEKSSN